MKIWFLVCITLSLDIKAVFPSTSAVLPNYNLTDNDKESTSTSSSISILSEIPSIMDAYNSKAVLTFRQPCSYKAEMEFISDLVTKSDHADISSGHNDIQVQGHLDKDDRDTSPPPVLFEREKLLHGMKQLIQNSDGLCDYKKQLTCRKDNKCGYGSTSNAESEAEAGFALDGCCKSGLPSQSKSPCIISQYAQAQMSGSSSVADSTDFRDDSSYFSVQDKEDHDHALIVDADQTRSPSFNESARGQHAIRSRSNGNVTTSASSAHMGLRMYETTPVPAPAPAAMKTSHKYSEFSDSISTITICMHFFLLTTSIVIMMVSFVLS